MKSYWSRHWLVGWVIILSVALIYELVAFGFEVIGTWTFPTLSSIIVGLIPLRILEPLTLIIALVLCWHWWDLKKKQDRQSSRRPRGTPAGRDSKRERQ